MTFPEPTAIALVLTVLGALLALSAVSSRASTRAGLPVILLFLAIGMLAGSEGIGGIEFDDYHLAFRIGTAALVLILFDGGLNTTIGEIRRSFAPAAVLATAGVVATAGTVALAARVVGFEWPAAILLGAIVSSTDAAAVFSILRGSGMQLRRRVGSTLELESGANDPAAVILTFTITDAILGGAADPLTIVPAIVVQLAIGSLFGYAIGRAGSSVVRRLGPSIGALYPVLTLSAAFLAFGIPTLFGGSGILAVYVAGVVIGNRGLPHRTALLNAHDFLAWLSQVLMFLTLGLLAFPSRLLENAAASLGIALFLAFVGRPLVVAACLAPFRFSRREIAFAGWVGLRGAVPIILATFPVQAGIAAGREIFDVVFFVVLVSVVLQGGTVRLVARRLGVEAPASPLPQAVMEISSSRPVDARVLPFYFSPALAVAGARIADIPFPRTSAIVLVMRGSELIVPRGDVVLLSGDHVYVLFPQEDEITIRLLFGAAEDE
jgi:potassium/hydrogen antiporter